MSLLEAPMRPGEVLQQLYLAPLNMGAIALARRLGVPRTRIERLVKESLIESEIPCGTGKCRQNQ